MAKVERKDVVLLGVSGESDSSGLTTRLSELLSISESQASSLLHSMPVVVRKAIQEEEANQYVEEFGKIGLEACLREARVVLTTDAFSNADSVAASPVQNTVEFHLGGWKISPIKIGRLDFAMATFISLVICVLATAVGMGVSKAFYDSWEYSSEFRDGVVNVFLYGAAIAVTWRYYMRQFLGRVYDIGWPVQEHGLGYLVLCALSLPFIMGMKFASFASAVGTLYIISLVVIPGKGRSEP